MASGATSHGGSSLNEPCTRSAGASGPGSSSFVGSSSSMGEGPSSADPLMPRGVYGARSATPRRGAGSGRQVRPHGGGHGGTVLFGRLFGGLGGDLLGR